MKTPSQSARACGVSNRVARRLESALTYHRRGALARARDLYEEVLRADPMNFDARHLLGVLAAQSNRPSEAVALISRALAADPHHHNAYAAYANLALAYKALAAPREALQYLERALVLRPDYAEALNNRGAVLQDLEEFEAALLCHDRAIAVAPGDPAAHYNRGNALYKLGRFAEALQAYQTTLAHAADHLGADLGRANALHELGRFDEALARYERLLERAPQCPEAHLGRSTIKLLEGDWQVGLAEYEWRFRIADGRRLIAPERVLDRPRWDRSRTQVGERVLLHAEQGLGDTLQFARYALPIAALGAIPILEVQAPLVGLLRRSFPDVEVIERGAVLPPFDRHCPLMSLPHAFATTPSTVPGGLAYLRSDPALRAAWRQRLGRPRGLRVGVVWRGAAWQLRDAVRSIALEQMLRHLPQGPEYVSVQRDLTAGDRERLASRPDILDVADGLDDFDHTAALCDELDLIVSVDTSVAHLAAALGRPTWLLLSNPADWRWLRDRGETPWYESVRILRQPHSAVWEPVLAQVALDLTAWAACPAAEPR